MGVDDPAGRAVVVGRAAARPRQRARGGLRHRLGVRRRQGPHPRPGLGGRRREAGGGGRRSCATTTTASRSPRARSSGTPQEVHARQHYELVDWRRADSDLNYRRFFAINTLAGLRVEDPEVFDATHELVLELVRDGAVDGLRIDHPDGLADPKGYLDRLAEASGGRWTVVEKILEPGEDLPESWATAGTTGYDALTEVDQVLVDPAGEAALTALDTELAGAPVDYAELVRTTASARSPTACSARRSPGWCGSSASCPAQSTPAQQTEALAELLASFDVYRSYLPDGREHLDATVAAVRERRPDLAAGRSTRCTRCWPQAGTEAATRFEQTSGPVMAKGVEDSAYYRWARFVALNEVGGDPARFGSTVEEFHAAQARRLGAQAAGDDDAVDARHQAQRGRPGPAGRPGRAADGVGAAGARLLARHPLADRPLAHLVWQNLVGAWPLSRERAHAYAEKAAREAGHVDHLDRPGRGVRGAAARAGRRRVRRPGHDGGDRGLRRPHRAARLVELAGAEAGAADDARRPGRLPGHRAVGLLAGRPRQPASGRLRPAPAAAGRAGRGRGAGGRRDRRGQAAGRLAGAAGAAGHPGAVHRLHAGDGDRARPPSTWSPSTAAPGGGVVASRPGCRSGWPRTAGATPRCSCPPAPGATCSPASGSSPTPAASPPTRCSPGCPVALLVRE